MLSLKIGYIIQRYILYFWYRMGHGDGKHRNTEKESAKSAAASLSKRSTIRRRKGACDPKKTVG